MSTSTLFRPGSPLGGKTRPLRLLVAGALCVLPLFVTPLARAADPPPQGISLNVRDVDIKDVLDTIASTQGLNVVCGPDVSGHATLKVDDLSLDETLHALLHVNGLTYVKRGGVIYVTREGSAALKGRSWLETVTFRLSYADPTEITKVVTAALSDQGLVTAYQPTRSVVVQDTPESIDRVRSVISALDVAPRQVLIGARILDVRLDDDDRMGVDWAAVLKQADIDAEVGTESFSLAGSGGVQGFFATLASQDLNVFLDALGETVDFEALAAPQVLALEGKQAEIIVGGKLGFYVTTTTQTSTVQSVEFLNIGSLLVITPTVSDNGDVILEIHPKVSDGVVENGLPSETTTEVTTTVLVSHGETVFIGGLIRRREQTNRSFIPILGHIPGLGFLFGRHDTTRSQSELVVLITPYVVQPGEEHPRLPLDLDPEHESIVPPEMLGH
jgi:type II secretory pathway component GspD/PulD (secretin)